MVLVVKGVIRSLGTKVGKEDGGVMFVELSGGFMWFDKNKEYEIREL